MYLYEILYKLLKSKNEKSKTLTCVESCPDTDVLYILTGCPDIEVIIPPIDFPADWTNLNICGWPETNTYFYKTRYTILKWQLYNRIHLL